MLTDRANVTLESVKAELAEVEKASRLTVKRLKALIRVLEAEAPKPPTADDVIDPEFEVKA